ncbi:MAG: tetratricopeptide repeat protein [Oligoflexus sp.]
MRHVSAIKKLIASGQLGEAHEALEELLEIGPQNMEALKLLAALYLHQGRFDDEEKIWRRIYEIENDDEEVLEYFHRVQIEDREHYYFTDILPDGGRRFIAYPRSLVNISIIGLLGCIVFLVLTRLSTDEEMLQSPVAVMVSFVVLVISPWAGILYTWTKSLRSVEITRQSIEVATRFRSISYKWDEIERICLVHSNYLFDGSLKLLILPRQNEHPTVVIDFSENRSSIRARRHLINEIKDFHNPIQYTGIESFLDSKRPTVSL